MAFDYLKTCQEVGELQFKISNYFILISGSKHQVFFFRHVKIIYSFSKLLFNYMVIYCN